MPTHDPPRQTFSNPLPGVVLGDPFALRWRGRFYLYGTNDGPPLTDGRQIPVFRSDDLIHWELLGGALEPTEPESEHWAPEVLAWNGRFFMVVSFGDVDRRGHALWVATAETPEGPFRMSRRISDPSETFSIDGAWFLDDDGRLYLFRCLDFVEEGAPPHGTGIVAQPMRDPLTPSGPPSVVLRAHSPWHLFEADRVMPLYGGRSFAAWTTIEGPAPVRRAGRVFCGYSGGNFTGAYGTGEAVADGPLGPFEDLRGRVGPLFGTTPGLVEGPGHFSVIRPDLIADWIVLHGRVPGESVRRVWLCPARWGPGGIEIGALTDQSQPAPALTACIGRFDGPAGPIPPGWRAESGTWGLDGEGLRHDGPAGDVGLAWREDPAPLAGRWVVEAHVRFPEPGDVEAGLAIRLDSRIRCVALRPGDGLGRLSEDEAELARFRLPTLGDEPFDPVRFHSLMVRSDSGSFEVRLDGVRVADLPATPTVLAGVGLTARRAAVFDGVSVASGEQASRPGQLDFAGQ
jgi:arabinan endo-1,5-alpha-L-arabinosidase